MTTNNNIFEIKLLKNYFVQKVESRKAANRIILSSMEATWGLEEQLNQYSPLFSVPTRDYLAQFYQDAGFNVSQIGKKLGISRVTVYDWLKWTEGKPYGGHSLPETEDFIKQWELKRHIWTPIIYSKDIQIKIPKQI